MASPRPIAVTPAHVAALARFERRAFTGVYASHRFTAQQFRELLADGRTIAHAVTDGTSIVGYALGIHHSGRLSHLARLHSIAVAPGHRRRGLGHVLLAAFLRASKARGCRAALLEVAVTRREARALFVRHGFRPWKRLLDYYGPGADGIRMRCTLT